MDAVLPVHEEHAGGLPGPEVREAGVVDLHEPQLRGSDRQGRRLLRVEPAVVRHEDRDLDPGGPVREGRDLLPPVPRQVPGADRPDLLALAREQRLRVEVHGGGRPRQGEEKDQQRESA